MTKTNEIYKCSHCGMIVEVVEGGGGQLVCCGDPMEKMNEQTADSSTEKHVPVVERANGSISVKVGSVDHPMEEKHYIQWIEIVYSNGSSDRKFLKPGDAPVAIFKDEGGDISVREYCTIHGLWKA